LITAIVSGVSHMDALKSITGSHVGHAFIIGLVAGAVTYLLDVYVVQALETSLGVTPGGV
jgi:hypothetical protein